jgi:RNA polymerase sigma factor for flagellar operon FliA
MSAVVAVGSKQFAGRVVNISEVGALLALPNAIPSAKDVTITMTLAEGSDPVTLHATIVRSTEETLSRHAVAVRFGAQNAAVAEAIRTIVERTNRMAWDGAPGRIPRDVAVRLVPMIRRVARGIAHRLPPRVSTDDLVGAGFVALVELYASCPHASIGDLERVAMPRIRWAMLDELRNSDPLSRRMRQRARRIAKAARDLQQELGRKPSDEEVAKRLNLSARAYNAALKLSQTGEPMSIDAVEDFELPDSHAVGPEDRMNNTESLRQLKTAMEALPPRLKKILELYYGDELTLRQIGSVLGVTEARISQLLSDAVKRLRGSYATADAACARRKTVLAFAA